MDIISVLDAMEAAAIVDLPRQAIRSLDNGPGGLMLLAGRRFDCVYANAAFSGLAARELPAGRAFFDLFPELEGQAAHALFDRVATHRRPYLGDGKTIGLDVAGMFELRAYDVGLWPILDMTAQCIGLLVHCRLSPGRHAHAWAPVHGRDRLTGLADYGAFHRALEQALAAPAGHHGMAVALDLSRFHRVNACFGREGGDRILRDLATRLRGAADRAAVVARAGANRFLFLFDGLDERAAAAPVRLADALATPFHYDGLDLYLSASIGIARFPEHGDAVDQVMAALEHALAEARRDGPGAVREGGYVEGRERERARMALALRQAIDNGGLAVHYQPQVDLKTGVISGVEALVRWTDAVAGPVPADTIVRLAEEAGLIGRLGERVLLLACAQTQSWRGMGFRDLRVAVNLSAKQVCMKDLERTVLDTLEQTGLPASNLDLELTESVAMDNVAEAVACFERLKGHGVQLSLDDFGTGYSSLAYLRLFPIDTLKIDRLFLDLVPDNSRAAGLVGTIIAAAHGLGMRVVAEGVEHEAQLRFLARSRCDEIQGYFFSKPVATEQMTSMLLARRALPPRLRRKATHAPAILLVDSDLARRCALGALAAQLLPHGGRILYAGSAAEAIRMFGEAPDLILAGPALLGMPGTAFLGIARQLCPTARRVLLLGHERWTRGQPADPQLADAVLAWPEGHDCLLERMRVLLRQAAPASRA